MAEIEAPEPPPTELAGPNPLRPNMARPVLSVCVSAVAADIGDGRQRTPLPKVFAKYEPFEIAKGLELLEAEPQRAPPPLLAAAKLCVGIG